MGKVLKLSSYTIHQNPHQFPPFLASIKVISEFSVTFQQIFCSDLSVYSIIHLTH